TGEGTGGRVLPHLPGPPAARQRGGLLVLVGGQEQRCIGGGPVPHHVVPPVGIGVDDGSASDPVAVPDQEVRDPLPHLLLGQPVVAVQAGVALEVDHAGQGAAVGRPAAAVVQEEVDLLVRSSAVGTGEVVAAAHEARLAGAGVLVVEVRAAVGGPL